MSENLLGKKFSRIAGDGKSDDNLSPQRWSMDEMDVRTAALAFIMFASC
jgi:hypothetical protein